MSTFLIILTVCILLIVFLLIYLVAPAKSNKLLREPFQNRNIAHRGLHDRNKAVPENSMGAFAAAIEAGYGIELDIQFSKDERMVVFHDNTLKRVCGIDKRVDELTYDELKELSLCKTTEQIPLFSDVLSLVNGSVPLIVELKNGSKNTLLCEKSYELLKQYNGDYCVESFQPFIVAWFRKHAPHILRGQLSAPAKEFKGELKFYEAFALSHLLTNVIARPHFIAYHKKKYSILVKLCEALGAMRVVWTVRDTDNVKKIESKNDTIIFEFYHPDLYF